MEPQGTPAAILNLSTPDPESCKSASVSKTGMGMHSASIFFWRFVNAILQRRNLGLVEHILLKPFVKLAQLLAFSQLEIQIVSLAAIKGQNPSKTIRRGRWESRVPMSVLFSFRQKSYFLQSSIVLGSYEGNVELLVDSKINLVTSLYPF